MSYFTKPYNILERRQNENANTLFDAYVKQLFLMRVKDKTMFSVVLIEISFCAQYDISVT